MVVFSYKSLIALKIPEFLLICLLMKERSPLTIHIQIKINNAHALVFKRLQKPHQVWQHHSSVNRDQKPFVATKHLQSKTEAGFGYFVLCQILKNLNEFKKHYWKQTEFESQSPYHIASTFHMPLGEKVLNC